MLVRVITDSVIHNQEGIGMMGKTKMDKWILEVAFKKASFLRRTGRSSELGQSFDVTQVLSIY